MTSVVSAQGCPRVTPCLSLMLVQGGPVTLCVMVLPRPADPAGPSIMLCLSLMLAQGGPLVTLCLSLMLAQGRSFQACRWPGRPPRSATHLCYSGNTCGRDSAQLHTCATVATRVVETVPSYTPVLTCAHCGNTALALAVLTCPHRGNTALALTVLTCPHRGKL